MLVCDPGRRIEAAGLCCQAGLGPGRQRKVYIEDGWMDGWMDCPALSYGSGPADNQKLYWWHDGGHGGG